VLTSLLETSAPESGTDLLLAGPNQGFNENATNLPPPICPTLVLNSTEARFAVPVNALSEVSVEGELDIIGHSGNPLLSVAVKPTGSGDRCVVITMTNPKAGDPVYVGPPQTGPRSDRKLEIRTNDRGLYGELVLQESGQYNVIKDGRAVMLIGGRSGDGARLAVTNTDGQQMAKVTCGGESFGGVMHLEVRVHPRVDAVLVLSCVLAAILLF